MSDELVPIPGEVKALLNVTRTCPDGISYSVREIARDCETTEPVLIVSVDRDADRPIVMSVEQFTYGYVPLGHLSAARDEAAKLPPVADEVFKHFKGNMYRASGYAYDVRSMAIAVVYRSLYRGGCSWVRPYASGPSPWSGTVTRDGVTSERFSRVIPARDPYEEVAE